MKIFISHELDLIQWFFGLPLSVYAVDSSPSKLEIDVEDNVSAIFKCKDDENIFPVNLHLSFTQKLEERYFSILLQDALLKCNLFSNEIKIIENDGNVNFQNQHKNVSRNDLFKLEMEEFIRAIENNKQTSISVSEGKKSLYMAIGMHRSLLTNSVVNL